MSDNNEPSIEELKQSLDILNIAELYGELQKTGANYKYKDNSSIVINADKQIFSDFNGNITGGSVLDLIMYMEKKNLADGIKRLKELNGQDTYKIDPALQIKRKEEAKEKKEVDFQKLGFFGKNDLNNVKFRRPAQVFDKDNNLTHYIVSTEYQKLFETKTLPLDATAKIDYLHKNILGYSEHFQCASIILRDDKNSIVDIIAYRPVKPESYENWSDPKYIYKNSHNRGQFFLYPFRKEVESIMSKQTSDRYFIVGEGIKNGLNALLYSVPFITLESTSNKIDQRLIDYIKDYINRGYSLITMFDGDLAGAKAYLNFIKCYYQNTIEIINNFIAQKENTLLPDKSNKDIVLSNYINFINANSFNTKNFLNFDSGLDFVDYLQSEDK